MLIGPFRTFCGLLFFDNRSLLRIADWKPLCQFRVRSGQINKKFSSIKKTQSDTFFLILTVPSNEKKQTKRQKHSTNIQMYK